MKKKAVEDVLGENWDNVDRADGMWGVLFL